MKVALFTETYDNIDGVTTTIRQFEKYLKKKNHEIIVITHAGQLGTYEGYARVFRLPPRLTLNLARGYPIDLIPPLFRAREILEREKPDVIHTISPGSCGLAGLYCSKKLIIPIVSSFHTLIPQYGRYHMRKYIADITSDDFAYAVDGVIGPPFEKMVWEGHFLYYSLCDKVLVPDCAFEKMFEKRLGRDVEVFKRGVDTDFFSPEKREDLINELGAKKDTLLLYVGRVVVEKDLDILADAVKRIDAHLVVVGDGMYLPRLKEKIRENVSFLGFIPIEKLSVIYASCDIFVFPSTTDTIGLVVLEAQASGLPVVVSDRGGPKSIMDEGKTGFVTRARDAKDFAGKISVLVNDRELRKKMGKQARAYALQKNLEIAFNNLISIHEDLLHSPRRDSSPRSQIMVTQ
jgi:glycosyltransferase involved in cell wall biosynthesis